MASKAAEEPSDISGGSGNNLKTEEPAAKDSPKNTEGVGNGVNTEEGAQAATSESVGGSKKLVPKEEVRAINVPPAWVGWWLSGAPLAPGDLWRHSRYYLGPHMGVVEVRQARAESGRQTREAAAQALDEKLKKYVHEREALDAIMKDVAVIKEKVIKEKVKEKGGFWAIFQRS